jgi:hypothetical protein
LNHRTLARTAMVPPILSLASGAHRRLDKLFELVDVK